MIKKWALGVMLITMIAAPMLACGFPLPAGSTALAPSKAVCARDEPVESCNLRRDAYQLMSTLNSASVTDLAVELYIDDGAEITEATVTGGYDYVVSDTSDYLGADLRAFLSGMAIDAGGTADDLSGSEVLIIDDIGYTYNADRDAWLKEQLDASALIGLSFLFGVTGTDAATLDLFSMPETFTVTPGEPVEHMGQQMIVQTLTVDLEALASNQAALTRLYEDAQASFSGSAFDPAALGDANQVLPMAAVLLPFLEGTAVNATLWIGAEDGYIHYIDEQYVLALDLSAQDPDAAPMAMRYNLQGTITNHNAEITITPPENVVEAEGSFDLDGGLFGN